MQCLIIVAINVHPNEEAGSIASQMAACLGQKKIIDVNYAHMHRGRGMSEGQG